VVRERSAEQGWDGVVIVDAGDAFSPTPDLPGSRREATVATAQFIVDQYNAAGGAAMTLGDRDLALGRETLMGLASRARFPFLAANLSDPTTGQPLFGDRLVVERAGVRIGIVGLISPSGALSIVRRDGDPALPWKVGDPALAARLAMESFAQERVDFVVALSHLSPEEEAAVVVAAPGIRAFLGGQTMSGQFGTGRAGDALAVLGGMKGKQVGLFTVALGKGRASNSALRDAAAGRGAADRVVRARARVDALEKRLASARERLAGEQPAAAQGVGANTTIPGKRRISPPIGAWEQQLAGAKAELQLALDDVAAEETSGTSEVNEARYELVNLGNNIADDPEVKAAVDAFRERYPDPTKRPPNPAVTPSVTPPSTPPSH